MSAHSYRIEDNYPLDPCGLASWRALYLDNPRANPYCLAAPIFHLIRARRFYAGKVSYIVRIYLAGNLAICNPFYLSSIIPPPYLNIFRIAFPDILPAIRRPILRPILPLRTAVKSLDIRKSLYIKLRILSLLS